MKTKPCDLSRLSDFLRGELSLREEAEFTQHLDACRACRMALERQAADETSWTEAHELLQDARQVAGPDLPVETTPDGLPLPVRQVLELLRPTDDPNSLGRLDSYEVLGVVGCGAMGAVLKAYDRPLDRVVALKVMHPVLASSGTARQRFAREAKAAAGVLHSNVVAIYGVSTTHSLPYLVMPYLRGSSLQQRIEAHGPLSLSEILRIGSQLAAGLAAAHQEGLIHRDIKPANIMLDDGVETVVITDFGLARAIDDATMTRSGAITGTPEFMSPEQARGESIGFSSDIFSLGSVLYVLCTGRPPFRAQTAFGVLRRITDEQPTAIRELNPEIPEWLCDVIQRLQAKNPNHRPKAIEAHITLQGCLAHVHQPDAIPLPTEVSQQPLSSSPKTPLFRFLAFGALAMTVGSILLSIAIGALPLPIPNTPSPIRPDEEKTEKLASQPKPSKSAPAKSEPSIFKTITVEFPMADQPGNLVIDINRGFVEVQGHDQRQVVIEILDPPTAGKMSSKPGEIKQMFAPKYDFDINKSKNEIKLDTYNQDYPLNLRIKVPVRTNLSLDTYYNGYLQVKNVTGAIHTHSQNCDIRLLEIAGTATAFSYNGDMTVTFTHVADDAELDFENYNGSIDLQLPADIAATTGITTGRGTYGSAFKMEPLAEMPAVFAAKIARSNDRAAYQLSTINGGGIPIRIETEKGSVTLRKPPKRK